MLITTTETEYRDKINLLSKKANVCGLVSIETIPMKARMIIKIADQAKRTLSSKEIDNICTICEVSKKAITGLIEKSPTLIAKASASLLNKQPELIAPGGGLFPESRAAACWRDCDEFMRVITYGVACNCAEISDKAGMGALLELYELLGVPTKALLYVLQN